MLSELSHCLQKTNLASWTVLQLNEKKPTTHKWPHAVMTMPYEFIACLCGFTIWVNVSANRSLAMWWKTCWIRRHTCSRMSTMIWSITEKKKTWIVLFSVEVCAVPSQKTNERKNVIPEARSEGSEVDGNQQWRWKMKNKQTNKKKLSQALKSLKKAAVAIFPLPTKYSQTFVKLRIYCCFTAFKKPKT